MGIEMGRVGRGGMGEMSVGRKWETGECRLYTFTRANLSQVMKDEGFFMLIL